MQNDPNNVWQKLKKWSAVILLAALCIGGTVLAVCRMVDPELYDSITAPVREGAAQGLRMAQEGAAMLGRGLEALGQGAQDLAQGARRQWDQACLALYEWLEPEPEVLEDPPEEDQLAGQVELDEAGYVVAGENCQTNLPGVFAAGDLRQKPLRQIITAAADGAVAAQMAEEFLQRERT